MSALSSSRLKFSAPPVVLASLTVFFEPVENLQASHLSSLRELWKDHYPNLAELPPLRTRNRGGDEAELVPITSWPCPYIMFSTDDDHSSIAMQSDRFIRSWSFRSAGTTPTGYPGFDELRRDLVEHFEQFKQTLDSELGQALVVTGSECDYLNALDVEITTESLMVGVTTRWASEIDAPVASAISYGGVRLHLCGADDLDGCAVTLRLDVDSDGPMLGIQSAFDLEEADAEADAALGGLDRAHDKLIETFIDYTSEDMQKQWGRHE